MEQLVVIAIITGKDFTISKVVDIVKEEAISTEAVATSTEVVVTDIEVVAIDIEVAATSTKEAINKVTVHVEARDIREAAVVAEEDASYTVVEEVASFLMVLGANKCLLFECSYGRGDLLIEERESFRNTD